jgi:hypothetical protein
LRYGVALFAMKSLQCSLCDALFAMQSLQCAPCDTGFAIPCSGQHSIGRALQQYDHDVITLVPLCGRQGPAQERRAQLLLGHV